MPRSLLALAVGILCLLPSSASPQEPLVQRLQDGETKRIYWAINLKGVVYLSVRGRDGFGCARIFWRPIPHFGRTFSLNDVCGNRRIEIPDSSSWAIGGQLYARANQGNVAIVLSSTEQLTYDLPPFEFT